MKTYDSTHKLSASGKLAVVIGLAFLGAPAAFAANIEAVGDTKVTQQKGVDIVNIVKPNEQGLSHNKYNKYDVSKSGAVLNNALQAGQSKLAGQLNANTNFNGKAAEVILNEVVSKNPSLILGQQEIFGMAADYVLANPNGITYNGGPILNAPRSSLVVGKPEVVNGKLDSFTVGANGSNAALDVKGMVGSISILDLVAPRVIVNAGVKVSAKDAINVVSGANKVSYTNGTVEKIAQDAKAPVLDGQIFGSMNAGSIRIHATDARGSQTIGNAQLTASKELSTDVAGKLNITASQLSGEDITLVAGNTNIAGQTQSSGPKFTSDQGQMEKRVKYTKQGQSNTETFTGSSITAKNDLTLSNSGNLDINGATIKAGNLTADANNIQADSTITTNSSSETFRRTKGLWHNQSTAASQDQTIHRTTIDVTGDANVNAKNTLTLKGTAVNAGKDVKLSGAKGVNLSGNTATDFNESGLDVRNESGKLKTGTAAKAERNQQYVATEIKAGGDLALTTEQKLTASGAKISAQGNALTDAGVVNFGTETTTTSSAVDDRFKYWGGIGGGAENGVTKTQENLQATSFTAGQNVVVGAKNGVNVAGSTVKGATGSFVNAGAGALNVKHATTSNSQSSTSRVGTIFNITKSKDNKNSNTEVVTGSTLASDANLQLVSDKDINLLGSTVQAAAKLGITTAGNLNIGTVAAKSSSQSETFGIKGFTDGKATASSTPDKKVAEVEAGLGVRFTKEKTDTQAVDQVGSNLTATNVELTAKENVTLTGSNVTGTESVAVNAANISATAAQDTVTTNTSKRVTEVGIKATAGASNFDPKVTVKAGVGSEYTNENTTNGTAQVSSINGGNVVLTADNTITHQGTQVNATGSLTQTADTINQTAAANTSDSTKVQHAGGIFIGAEASTSKGVGVSAGIYGNGGKAVSNSSNAVVTDITAGSVNTNAATVTDQATNYTVAQDVNINAGSYTNTAAANTTSLVANQGGASLTVTANTKDGQNVNVNAGLKVNYGHENTQTSDAVVGNINAGSVNIITKDDLSLASNVNATGGVNLASEQGDVVLTQSNSTVSSTKTGVDVGLNVGAKVNVATGAALPKGGVNVEVGHTKEQASKGTAGTVQANGDVNLFASDNNKVNVEGASILSEANVNLTAGEVNSQAISHSSQKDGVSVGVSVDLGTGLVKETTETTQQREITQQHLVKDSYCAPPRLVTSTSVVEETVTTETEKLAVTSVGVGAHADVVKEREVSHTANLIAGKGVTPPQPPEPVVPPVQPVEPIAPPPSDDIPDLNVQTANSGSATPTSAGGVTITATNTQGSGINLTGTNVKGGDVTLTAAGGNVNLDSAKGSLTKTNGGAGFSIEGDVDNGNFKPTGGSAYVNVDIAKNKTHTGSSVTGETVTINTPNDLNLNSSTITAQNVVGNVGGDLNVVAEQDVVNEVKVELSAAGGKGIDPKSLLKTENVTTTEQVVVDKVVTQQVVDPCGCTREETSVVQTVENREVTEQVTTVDGKKVAQTVLSDLQNGTILGVKAEAKADISVEKSKTSKEAGIQADNLDLAVTGDTKLQAAKVEYTTGTGLGDQTTVSKADNNDSSRKVDFGFDVSTNVPKMVEYGIQHLTTGSSPLFHASSSKTAEVVPAAYTPPSNP